ncbi:MAG: glycoside hydrolase family 2 TIM barrel-domain containing protein [Mangrovibacterium sp.]
MKIHNLIVAVACILFSCHEEGSEPAFERESYFNSDWKFIKGDVPGGYDLHLDDASWRQVDLPHDWSIEDLPGKEGVRQIGPFSEESEGGMSTGHVVGGTAWYRKHFSLNEKDKGKIVKVLFDGVYMDADVWINGKHLGNHPYGYTAFSFDLTEHLNPAGKDNVLAVRVKNEGKNSRWYSGSGIYRNVSIIKTDPVFFDLWGIYIHTPVVSDEQANVSIEAKVINRTAIDYNGKLLVNLLDPEGELVAKAEYPLEIAKEQTASVKQNIELLKPNLWSVDHPFLYTADVQICDSNKVIDRVTQKFGIRSIDFSPEKGFLLNGKRVLLKGGCLHHDNGILGSAAFDKAEYRRVKIMKENGFNAIRTAHNPPSKVFLDACDELGMLVIDESFDHWQRPKNEMDYHRFFDEWWEKDIESMVLRDRNHPSVIIWSFGNEINERADSSGLKIAAMLKAKIKSLDATRPATQAICKFWEFKDRKWEDTEAAFAILDVHGYNYEWQRYEEDHRNFPQRIMIGTESFPKEAFENWQMVKTHPYVIGDFVWTGMDYFGESGIGHTRLDHEAVSNLKPWPWFNAWCGDIDVLGYKKPQMYFRDVVWGNSELEMLVHAPVPIGRKEVLSRWGWPEEWPSWNWSGHEGKLLQVSVYSACDEVRLELNNQIIGSKEVSEKTNLTARFEVPYQPGELTAVGIKDGREVARRVLRTTGKPSVIKIVAEEDKVLSAGNDLAYFNIEIQDENGLLVPDAVIPVEFSVEGNGRLQAVGNGNPADMMSFQQPKVSTYRGRCQIIVRPGNGQGEIVVSARSEDLVTGTCKVVVE